MRRHTKYLDKFDKDQILKLSEEGHNLKSISEIIDIPARRLGEMLTIRGIKLKKGFSYSVNDEFFCNIDTELKAYLLGFFFGDGCIYAQRKGRQERMLLNNSIDDYDVIKLFRDNICPSKQIEFHNCQLGVKFRRKEQCRLRWSSSKMAEDLRRLNIRSNKTQDVNRDIPELKTDLIRHFIRGLYDADGTINRNVGLVSTSKNVLQSVVKCIGIEEPNYTLKECKNKSTYYTLCFRTSVCDKVLDYLYKDCTYYLKRKYNKYLILKKRRDNTEE